MSGHDVDVELALPYFPGLFAGYNQSKWYGEDGVADVERKSYRLKGNLSKNLSVEVGKRTYSSSIEDQNTTKLSYNYVFGADSDVPTIIDMDTPAIPAQESWSEERYEQSGRKIKSMTGFTVGSTSDVYRVMSMITLDLPLKQILRSLKWSGVVGACLGLALSAAAADRD